MRCRSLFFCFSAFFAFAVFSNSAWAFTGSYEETISMSERVVAKFKVTAKGEFVKTEFLNDENPEQVIKNASGTYRVIPSQKVALKLPDLGEKENLLDDMDNYQQFLQENQAKVIGSEKVQEKDTDIYEFVDPMTQKNAKAWVWKEKNLPLKIEVQANEGLLAVELSNVDLTSPIDDSIFTIPQDFKIVELKPSGPPEAEPALQAEASPGAPAAQEP